MCHSKKESGKRKIAEGIEQTNKKDLERFEKGNLKIPWYTDKRAKMKEKIKKEYPRRTRNLLETKLYRRNIIKEINIRAVSLVWHRLYVSRKEGGRGLASIEESIDTSMRCLEDYIKKSKKDYLQRPETTETRQWSTENNN